MQPKQLYKTALILMLSSLLSQQALALALPCPDAAGNHGSADADSAHCATNHDEQQSAADEAIDCLQQCYSCAGNTIIAPHVIRSTQFTSLHRLAAPTEKRGPIARFAENPFRPPISH